MESIEPMKRDKQGIGPIHSHFLSHAHVCVSFQLFLPIILPHFCSFFFFHQQFFVCNPISGGCDQAEQRKFNENLRKTFRDDYERSSAVFDTSEGATDQSSDIERRAVERKFHELDTNQDSFLQKKELNTMKRLMRKLIKPKVCVKSFTEHCDLNYDDMIAESEWMFCLGGEDSEYATPLIHCSCT